jgi:hypothetical protein
MNKSCKLALFVGGLAILTTAVLAQVTPDPVNNGTTMPPTTPVTTPADPMTPPLSPTPSAPQVDKSSNTIQPRNSASQANAAARLYGTDTARFKTMDTNNDGRISRAEFTLAGDNQLNAAGSTTPVLIDGSIDKTGTKPWDKKSPQDATATTDSNIMVSANSVEAFRQLDTDNDGYLTQAELAAAGAPDVK